MNILFIGIGEMGFGMSKNILAKNGSITIWNRTREKEHVNILINMGAQFASCLKDAVSNSDFICLNLSNDTAVLSVCNDIIPFIKKNSSIIDFSTISPDTAVKMCSLFAEAQAFYMDCPVSGGSQGALSGTLTIMAGGDMNIFETAKPLLEMCGTNIQYMGPSGLGQKAKLINQLLTWVNQAVVCEAMLLAEKSGINLSSLYTALSTSWGRSWMLERSVEKYIIPNKFEAPSGLELMVKDFNLITDMADNIGCEIPISRKAKEIYDQAMKEGLAKKDPSVIITVMRENLKRSADNEK